MSELFNIRIQVPSREAIKVFTAKWRLDYGDRVQSQVNENGFSIRAMVSEKVIAELKSAKIPVDIIESHKWNEADFKNLVGKGDRYQGGKIIPKRLI